MRIVFAGRKEKEMEKIKRKPGLLGTVLAAVIGVLVTSAVVTTASGCVVCRDCGPHRHFRR